MMLRCLTLLLALTVSACGFHLREALVLPEDIGAVKVRSVDRYSPLSDSLTQAIVHAGVPVAAADDANATVLDLLSERWGDTPIAVDQFGRAQEFSLRYAVVFEVRMADGTLRVPRQAIELSRDYVSNPAVSIGTEGEREILIRELRREMSASIIRRIDAVARTRNQVPTESEAQSQAEGPVAEEAAEAAIEAADANPPPEEPQATPPQPR